MTTTAEQSDGEQVDALAVEAAVGDVGVDGDRSTEAATPGLAPMLAIVSEIPAAKTLRVSD